MRTTLDLPDELLEEARQATRSRTKREAVITALEEVIRKARREELRKMAGTIQLEVDLARSRKKR